MCLIAIFSCKVQSYSSQNLSQLQSSPSLMCLSGTSEHRHGSPSLSHSVLKDASRQLYFSESQLCMALGRRFLTVLWVTGCLHILGLPDFEQQLLHPLIVWHGMQSSLATTARKTTWCQWSWVLQKRQTASIQGSAADLGYCAPVIRCSSPWRTAACCCNSVCRVTSAYHMYSVVGCWPYCQRVD